MKNRHRIITALMLLLAFLIAPMSLGAQQPLGKKEARQMLSVIDSVQTPWERVELNGKLKMEGLPVSPSLKIYMENGERLDISIRAPFVGEVGRIQASADSIVAVNKMKKVYWSASMEEVVRQYPGGLELFQNILLGRMVFFGEGPLSSDLQPLLNIFPDEEEGWLAMPKPKYQPAGARYGYVVTEEGLPAALIIERDDSDDFLQMDYIWKQGKKEEDLKHSIDVLVAAGSKEITALLSFDAPKWDCTPIQPMTVDRKYRPVSIRDFIKHLL